MQLPSVFFGGEGGSLPILINCQKLGAKFPLWKSTGVGRPDFARELQAAALLFFFQEPVPENRGFLKAAGGGGVQ